MKLSRRRLLAFGGVAAATMSARSWSSLARGDNPLNRIRVGVIGTGVRGKYLIGNLPKPAWVTAICDCATSRMTETLRPSGDFKNILSNFVDNDASECKTYQDYRHLIDREQLDAVIIATPDHHHVPIALTALDAGLDVYLEKPLSVAIADGRLLVNKVKETGRVLQVGSQQRTMEMNQFACEFIRDGGLGKISRVEVPNYPGPMLAPDYPAEPIPAGLDWGTFLGTTARRPHNRRLWVKDEFKIDGLLWRGWDLFRDFSGHLMTNWGAHNIDMVQYALGKDDSGPIRIELNSSITESALEKDWRKKWYKKTPRPTGSWKDASRFHPVTMEYADGTELQFLPGVGTATFYGEKGQMEIGRNRYRVEPAGLITDGPDPILAEKWNGDGSVARPHVKNWLDCIVSRGTPNTPVEVGHRSVTVCHLANIARELGRPLKWNPDTEKFMDDEKANQLVKTRNA